MATTERPTVVGVFENRTEAERAVDELHRAGFRDDQIGYAAHGGEAPEGSTDWQAAGPGEAGEGAAKGAVSGGIIGGILGALATGLIPGIGPVIAGGLLAGILGGAAAGAAAGGLFGALVGSMGVPEEEARYYDDEFKAGRTVVTVKADGRYDEARAILQRLGAYDYEARGARTGTTMPSAPGPATAEGERTMRLREEELRARKQPVQTGQVELGKEVVTEEKSMEVPRTREEVVVERRPVEPRPADRPIGEGGETVEVPVREERVQVEKEPVVYEEVGLGKQQVQETERVSDTVRREEARVEQEGDVDLRGDPRVRRREEPRP
jgi:uncharacterized protein (TIGR02271 family)